MIIVLTSPVGLCVRESACVKERESQRERQKEEQREGQRGTEARVFLFLFLISVSLFHPLTHSHECGEPSILRIRCVWHMRMADAQARTLTHTPHTYVIHTLVGNSHKALSATSRPVVLYPPPSQIVTPPPPPPRSSVNCSAEICKISKLQCGNLRQLS
jgi:hypothetical protein